VVWRRGDEVGVEFLASPAHQAPQPVDAEAAYAKVILK
jgi:hypothetical protein